MLRFHLSLNVVDSNCNPFVPPPPLDLISIPLLLNTICSLDPSFCFITNPLESSYSKLFE